MQLYCRLQTRPSGFAYSEKSNRRIFASVKQVKAILLTILSAYVMLVSCGFTVSHIYCQKGERWIIGSEMPAPKPCQKATASSIYEKSNDHSDNKDDDRNKDTFQFLFEFDAQVEACQSLPVFSVNQLVESGLNHNLDPTHTDEKDLLWSHGFLDPPVLNLPMLQVFRI